MAHSIPNNIKLNNPFNKIIRVGKTRKDTIISGAGARDKSLRVNVDGNYLDKPIQVYRMWYRFLQLALELEYQNVHIITKMQKTELKKPKKDKWGKLQKFEMKPIRQKVKVNRKKYQNWDIDSIPSTSFDNWWFGDGNNYPAHKELFYPENSISVLKNKDEWIDEKKYTYIRIDNRRRINEIENDLRRFITSQRNNKKMIVSDSVTDFPVNGYPNINTLINRYNALILQLTSTDSDKVMLASKIYRPTKEGVSRSDLYNLKERLGINNTKDIPQKELDKLQSMQDKFTSGESAYSYSGSPGRAMRDLILPAKISLLSVCDGYFVNNPLKDYL